MREKMVQERHKKHRLFLFWTGIKTVIAVLNGGIKTNIIHLKNFQV